MLLVCSADFAETPTSALTKDFQVSMETKLQNYTQCNLACRNSGISVASNNIYILFFLLASAAVIFDCTIW